MNFLDDINLAHYTTMRLGGSAKLVAGVANEQAVVEAIDYAQANNLKFIVIGEGSNIIFGDDGFDGLVIVNKITGLLIDRQTGQVRVGAGTHWHTVVEQTVDSGLVGIEAMALIPGTAGATPINNVGAYGQDISSVLQSVYAYDTATKQFVELSNEQCQFSYRSSIFKKELYGRYVIISVSLQLQPAPSMYTPPDYPALQQELARKEILYPAPTDVMQTVMNIRSIKLPDPRQMANSGSFFKNPIVSATKLSELTTTYPDIPHYPQTDGSEKLAAGWLIDQAGLRNHKERGMWIYDKQALVLVNQSADSYADLEYIAQLIVSTVREKFGVELEPEPEIFAT